MPTGHPIKGVLLLLMIIYHSHLELAGILAGTARCAMAVAFRLGVRRGMLPLLARNSII